MDRLRSSEGCNCLERFAFDCTGYPQCTNQPRMPATVTVSNAGLIVSISTRDLLATSTITLGLLSRRPDQPAGRGLMVGYIKGIWHAQLSIGQETGIV